MKRSSCYEKQWNAPVVTGFYRRAIFFILAVFVAVTFVKVPDAAADIDKKDKGSKYAYIGGDYEGINQAAKSVFYVGIFNSANEIVGSGSGFVMFDERLFITNQHVIDGASFLVIMDDDGEQYYLDQVVVSDAEHDIAILLFPEAKYRYEPLQYDTDFNKLLRGQAVLTIGSPKGLPGTVSDGIISGFKLFKDEDIKYIQITAPISHGSSGGCLLNENLKVIGVTSSGLETGENLGFAIPVSIVEKLYLQWNKKDTVALGTQRSWDTVGAGLHRRISGAGSKLMDLDEGLVCWLMEGGTALSFFEDNMFWVDVFNPGLKAWSVQPLKKDFQLIKGTEYELSWDMRCSTERDIEICFQHAEEDWHVYASEAFHITGTWKHYTMKFKMTDETDTNVQLAINLGKMDGMEGTAAMKRHQVYIDNIQLNAW